MAILATHHALPFWVRQVVPSRCDVDEKARHGIDPSRVDDVELVSLLPIYIMWVDFQHVVPSLGNPRGLVVEDRHIIVCGQVVHASLGDLNIHIGVPWHYLTAN